MPTFPIVQLNTTVTQAPKPSTLQQTGCFVTQGGSNTLANAITSVSTLAALQAILGPSLAITSLAWSGAVVTVTTASPHGWTVSTTPSIVIAGAVPAGYNGTFTGTVTGTSTVTYPLASNPGSETTPGTITLGAVSELLQMGTTYFAGNGVVGVDVLELGEGTVNNGVAALSTLIPQLLGSPQQQYNFQVPREWDANTNFITLAGTFTAPNAMQYFTVTTTVANRALYANLKSVYALVEAPGIGATEFSNSSAFGTMLKWQPSSTNKVPPLENAPSYATTAYPIRANQTIFNELAAANVNWIGSGQQGGVANNILQLGVMSDGNSWNFWYSVDWLQINAQLALTNEVINGSASSLNPLYYNQQGINRVQNRVVQTATQGVSYGLGNGQVVSTGLPIAQFLANYNSGVYADQIVVNAEPFAAYTAENPNDYGIGRYAGIAIVWIPQLGFSNIVLNINATTLLT